jgi:predicted restriction endonuclease
VSERWSPCTLQQLVEERGALTEEEARSFLEQIKFGLQLLRDKKIRHPVSPTLPLQCRICLRLSLSAFLTLIGSVVCAV